MAYRIVIGIRHEGVKFNMASTFYFPLHFAHIFIDCMLCDQSIGLKFDSNEESDNFSDEEATKIFKDHSWIIEPGVKILCPSCAELSKIVKIAS